MEQINPFRMLGRFDYAYDFLLKKYNIQTEGYVLDRIPFLNALSSHVNDYDRDFCLKMAQAILDYKSEIASMPFNQFKADQQNSIGRQEAEYVFKQSFDNYAEMILAPYDYLLDIEFERQQRFKEIKRNIILIIAIIAVIIISIIIYHHLPYYTEKRDYALLKEYYESDKYFSLKDGVKEYQIKYPDGKHLSEVLFLPVKYFHSNNEVIKAIEAAENYLKVDPNGSYAVECKTIINEIWDAEIKKYKNSLSPTGNKKAEDYLIKMLEYMKLNNVRTIDVVGSPILKLKEYNEYSSYTRLMMENYVNNEMGGGSIIGLVPKLPDDMVTIKDKVTIEEAGSWIKYLVYELNYNFNKGLTPGFIRFEESDSTKIQAVKVPVVNVIYTVKTEEDYFGYPNIWKYGDGKHSSKLYLGITMNFEVKFNLPETDINYSLTDTGYLGEENFKGIDSFELYSMMCKRITENFAKRVAYEFGLQSEQYPN